jgi:Transposase domain (DUF772)
MRGQQDRNGSLFSYVSIEERIPASHPLRRIRKLYSSEGRPSVPPEQLLLASFLQVFYGIRSERLLNEQIMGRFLVKLLGAPEVKPLLSNEHFSVDGTSCRPGPPMPRWSGSVDRTIHSLRHQAPARVSGQPRRERSVPRVMSAASSSTTRPTAPVLIRTRCYAENPRPIRHYPATEAMCSWTTAMP